MVGNEGEMQAGGEDSSNGARPSYAGAEDRRRRLYGDTQGLQLSKQRSKYMDAMV